MRLKDHSRQAITVVAFLFIALFTMSPLAKSTMISSYDLSGPSHHEDFQAFVEKRVVTFGMPAFVVFSLSREAATWPPVPIPDDAWNESYARGCKFISATLADDAGAAKILGLSSTVGTWNDFGDLKKWGWDTLEFSENLQLDAGGGLPILTALQELGITTTTHENGGDNYAIVWEHENVETIDGKTYPATGASYASVFNVASGMIVMWGAYGCAYKGQQQNPPVTDKDDFPKLNTWADVTWLQWQELAGDNVKNLQYIFSSPVENEDSNGIIQRALDNVKQPLAQWPGRVELSMDTEEGRAILGSANGRGVAWMLINHKAQLGLKTIDSVIVFKDEGGGNRVPTIVFKIKDAEPSL